MHLSSQNPPKPYLKTAHRLSNTPPFTLPNPLTLNTATLLTPAKIFNLFHPGPVWGFLAKSAQDFWIKALRLISVGVEFEGKLPKTRGISEE